MAENYSSKRWMTLVVACIINIIIGTGYAWSVFAGPWAEALQVPSAAMAFSVCNAVGFITMILGGRINDALGPKWVIFVGGLMFGGGALLAGFSPNLTVLIVCYGLILGLGMGLVYSCTIGNTVKFFPDKKGMVGGVTTATYGLGSVILAPVAQWMVNSFEIRTTFKVLGAVYLIVICVGAFLITRCPDGFIPEGWTPPAPAAGVKKVEDKTWQQMIKDPIFYVMFIMILCGAFFGLMMISQCKAVASSVGIAGAATIVSVLALCNALGRVACGVISDKIGRINTLTLGLIIAVIGLAMIYVALGSKTAALFVVGVCFVGFCFGAYMGVYPGFTSDQFGTKNSGVNYGIMFIGFSVAGVVGPMIMTHFATPDAAATAAATAAAGKPVTIFEAASYQPAILIALGLSIVGLVLTFVYRAMSKAK